MKRIITFLLFALFTSVISAQHYGELDYADMLLDEEISSAAKDTSLEKEVNENYSNTIIKETRILRESSITIHQIDKNHFQLACKKKTMGKLEVYNLKGQQVLSKEFSTHLDNIFLLKEGAGYYIANIFNPAGQETDSILFALD